MYIDDKNYAFPGNISWYFKIPGEAIAGFLRVAILKIKNKRKMINVSVRNLEQLGYKKIKLDEFDISERTFHD